MSGSLGATSLHQACQFLEQAVRAKEYETVDQRLPEFETAAEEVFRSLEALTKNG